VADSSIGRKDHAVSASTVSTKDNPSLDPITEHGETNVSSTQVTSSSSVELNPTDPMNFGRHRRDNVSQRQMKIDHPNGNKKALKKFYTRQNELIDQFLGADDEERQQVEEDARMAPKIKFAVYASFTVNFCLFLIQMYAAISTGSLSLFATAADAFVGPRALLPLLQWQS